MERPKVAAPLVEGVDFYMEGGKFVFSERYHLKRGYCCNSRCRHCPYGNAPRPGETRARPPRPAPVVVVPPDPDPSKSST